MIRLAAVAAITLLLLALGPGPAAAAPLADPASREVLLERIVLLTAERNAAWTENTQLRLTLRQRDNEHANLNHKLAVCYQDLTAAERAAESSAGN